MAKCSFQQLAQTLCLQLIDSSISLSSPLFASIRSQQTSHKHSSSANCSSTMKLFSEYIFGLFPFPAPPPPPDVVAVVFVNRAELGCNKSGYGRAGGGG